MEGPNDRQSEAAEGARPAYAQAMSSEAKPGSPAVTGDPRAHPDQDGAPTTGLTPGDVSRLSAAGPRPHRWRKRLLLLAGTVAAVALGGYVLLPWLETAMSTVSTDDAYVNSHVTFVAPRVTGQVSRVLVDDNYRVKKGDVLVQLDPEPYQVQVAIKKAALEVAETDLTAAQAQVRGQVAQARANRFKLEHAVEEVDTQIANLRAGVATLTSRRATLQLAQANLKRGEELAPSGASTQ
jgi:membrane fusion protein, multidrug efflux system